jgi:hypothetical protein
MRPSLLLGILTALVLPATAAPGQETPVATGIRVTLKVGQTKVFDVGLAMGLDCNDASVVQATLRPTSATANSLVLKGLKPGKTACRAGTANMSRSRLVYLTVRSGSSE